MEDREEDIPSGIAKGPTANEVQAIVSVFVRELADWANKIKFSPYVGTYSSDGAVRYVTIEGDIECAPLANMIVSAAREYYGAGNVEVGQ